jgi:hypothetical protein
MHASASILHLRAWEEKQQQAEIRAVHAAGNQQGVANLCCAIEDHMECGGLPPLSSS